jgi:hypothetical protein
MWRFAGITPRVAFAAVCCASAAGCQGGTGVAAEAARTVAGAVSGRFNPPVPASDIRCTHDADGWTCRFDTKRGRVTCTLPRADAPSGDVRCTLP